MPHFRLVTTDCEALGPHELSEPDWLPGTVIQTVRDELPEWFTVLVVEPAGA